MKSFFDLLRPSGMRRATKEEMEGFGPEPPEPQETDYIVDPVLIMPEHLSGSRTKQGAELEGPDRGLHIGELEPGTDIPREREEALALEGRAARDAQRIRHIAEMREMAIGRAETMDLETLQEYVQVLEVQVEDSEQRAVDLFSDEQRELAEAQRDETEALRAQVQVIHSLLEARKKAQ